jgi:O-antigen ligase
LRLLEWVAKLWGEPGSYRLHMHSAFLEMLVDQGIVGILLMYGVYWTGYKFYQRQYLANTAMAPLYAAFVYMMFAWQIDIVGYAFYSGFCLVFILMGPVVMKDKEETAAGLLPENKLA